MTNQPIQTKTMQYPEVAAELAAMVVADQEKRTTPDYSKPNVDIQHTARLKQIILQIGWPTLSKVGTDGAHHAWLLAQHADLDPQFQAEVLALMKSQPAGEVSLRDIAYLEDRVALAQGRSQIYGTQGYNWADVWYPKTIIDRDNLDARRADVGLPPFKVHLDHMQQVVKAIAKKLTTPK